MDPRPFERTLIERLRTPWDGMGDMANAERAMAAQVIERLLDEVEKCRRVLPARIERILYEGEG
jgi:hypothetical protein